MSKRTFLLSGGGTGGHVYPAIAIADALKSINAENTVEFAGTRNRMEWIAVPKAGYPIHEIWISGIQRRLTLKNLAVPFKLVASLWQSRKLIKKVKPDAVICTGGYVSGPIGWTAGLMGIPLFLQEQNSYPGVTTRLLSRFATIIFTAFDDARKWLPSSKIMLLGNPVRSSILEINENPHTHFGFDSKKKTILILGGSGGAKAINDTIMKNLKFLHDDMNLQIIWQSGNRYLDAIKEVLNISSYPNLRLYSFIDHMPNAYATADFVVSRAGASICSELMVTGKPSVLIPSPNVAGDHQTMNAKAMEAGGASLLLKEQDINKKFREVVVRLLQNDQNLSDMKSAALEMAKPDAAHHIATEISTILNRLNHD